VAVLFGAVMTLTPTTIGDNLGYSETPADLVPVLRNFGVLLLFFGGTTSLLAIRAKSWERVEIILLAEIVYSVAETVLYVFNLLAGAGPVLANASFLIITVALLVLFVMSWRKRPA
jgi:hypothetical protein